MSNKHKIIGVLAFFVASLILDLIVAPARWLVVTHVVCLVVFSGICIWLRRELFPKAPAVPLITKKHLEEEPMWTVFHGPVEDPGPVVWAIFEIRNHIAPDANDGPVESQMQQLRVWFEEPELDDEWVSEEGNWRKMRPECPDDHDAALAYLRDGGTLCKVPDTMTSPYYRLLVVRESRTEDTTQ